jgi:hypothetical protein
MCCRKGNTSSRFFVRTVVNKRGVYLLCRWSLLVWLLSAVGATAHAGKGERDKSTLTFSATIRHRYEYQNSFNQKYYGDNPARGSSRDGFLLGRYRVGVDWRPNENVHIALWGQHATCWGTALPDSEFYSRTLRRENNPNKDYWELYTTFIELKNLFNAGLGVKAGRQILAYGNNRVFGPGQWGNSGRYIWDAVKLSWVHQRGFVDIFYGQNMLHEVRRSSLKHRHEFETIGMYAHYDILTEPLMLFIEPMLFTKRDRHSNYTGEKRSFTRQPDGKRVPYRLQGSLDVWYAGARLSGSHDSGFDFDATFLQERGDFAHDTVKACGYHLLVGYRVPVRLNPRLSVEYSYASGDNNPQDGTRRTFHGAFGARDMMYGRMNLFHWMNLNDLQFNVEVTPAPWLYLKIEFHRFTLAERRDAWYHNQQLYRDPTGTSGSRVGKEIDIVATIKLPRGNTLMAGFGHFRPDTFAKKMASSKHAHWCFVQWEYRFSTGLL